MGLGKRRISFRCLTEEPLSFRMCRRRDFVEVPCAAPDKIPSGEVVRVMCGTRCIVSEQLGLDRTDNALRDGVLDCRDFAFGEVEPFRPDGRAASRFNQLNRDARSLLRLP